MVYWSLRLPWATARVGDHSDPCRACRCDDIAVLDDACPVLVDQWRGDEQEAVGIPEGHGEALGIIVIGVTYIDPAGFEIVGLGRVPDCDRELFGRDSLQEPVHHDSTVLTSCRSDDDHDARFLSY